MTDAIGLLRGAVVQFFRARRTVPLENVEIPERMGVTLPS